MFVVKTVIMAQDCTSSHADLWSNVISASYRSAYRNLPLPFITTRYEAS